MLTRIAQEYSGCLIIISNEHQGRMLVCDNWGTSKFDTLGNNALFVHSQSGFIAMIYTTNSWLANRKPEIVIFMHYIISFIMCGQVKGCII